MEDNKALGMPAPLYMLATLFSIVLLGWVGVAVTGWMGGGGVMTRMDVMAAGVMTVTVLVTKVGQSSQRRQRSQWCDGGHH